MVSKISFWVILCLFLAAPVYCGHAADENTPVNHEEDVVINPSELPTSQPAQLEPPGFKEYMYDTGIWYGVQWGARLYWVRDKSLKIFNTSLSKWWDNITTEPVWNDDDTFVVNWIAHPFFGMLSYQFYRARGHSRWSSALGSVIQSTLFEYAIEGIAVEPSLIDLVVTPALGVPLGIAMEEASEWLIEQDSKAAKVGAYITNPMRMFVKDRRIGFFNPLAGVFEFKGPIEFGPTKDNALDLGYVKFIESPLPLGRVMADLEVVALENNFGDQFFFYSIRLDLPTKSGFFGLYLDAPYGGLNNVDGARNGYEFANITIGAKQVLIKGRNSVVSAGLELYPPTAFTDGEDRLSIITAYRRDLPTYIYKAATVSPYLAGAVWKGPFSLVANAGTDMIFNAEEFQGDNFEFRLNYGIAAGVNLPVPLITPAVFLEFDGYTITTDAIDDKTDLFLTPGIRFGKRYSPGFALQIPVSGPTSEIAEVDFIFDLQLRF